MRSCRTPLFRNRQFEPIVIVTCVPWYLRFSLSLRDLEELTAERGLSVDHTTIWRWTQTDGPEIHRRMDETFVRIVGRWLYLFRAVDSGGQTIDFYLSETRDREAAKIFLKRRWPTLKQSATARVCQGRFPTVDMQYRVARTRNSVWPYAIARVAFPKLSGAERMNGRACKGLASAADTFPKVVGFGKEFDSESLWHFLADPASGRTGVVAQFCGRGGPC